MTIQIWENERVDDLLTEDLKIIQSDEVFSFSMDAVLLARFGQVPLQGKIIDLCSGNGVIPLLLTTRSKANIVGVEIQQRLYDMAERNVKLNHLEEKIQMIHGDLCNIHEQLGTGQFDYLTVNPPYLPASAGVKNENEYIAAARHELFCTLEDVVIACSKLLKFGGKMSMVHRPSRLIDLIHLLRKHQLEPKRIRFVHPRAEKEANMILIEAIKNGKPDVRLLPPLIVYETDQQYTQELLQIYYGQANELKYK